MWSIDARCSSCTHKLTCEDRRKLFTDLSPMINSLNLDEQFQGSPGDGIIILACHGFSVTPAP